MRARDSLRKINVKNKQQANILASKLQRVADLLEQLIAVEMYRGGATQHKIGTSLGMALGKVNRLVKGIKPPQQNHGKE